MAILKVALASLMVLGLVRGIPQAIPYGVAPSACEDLGGHFPGQDTESPYVAIPHADTVQPGQSFTVTLQAIDGTTPFQGYIMLAQTEGSETYDGIGTFLSVSSGSVGSCLGKTDNYVSHDDTADKQLVSAVWQAPADFTGNVVFRTTFGKDFNTFWVATTSAAVTVQA